jgi:RNA polymerase sigma-70 factor (ECF subfamily)
MVDKSATNCRQILRRAHHHLDQQRPRFAASREQQVHLTEQFLRASTSGEMQGLLNLLTDDIVFIGDGGGKAPVALKPIHGPDKVARGTSGGLRFFSQMQTRMEEVNGKPAIVGYLDGHPCGVLICEIEGERIRQIYAVVNPEKLRWLGKQTV